LSNLPEYFKLMTGEYLYNLTIDKIPCLVDPIFPKTGVVALVGSSDTGKSTILRQLSIAIVTGKETFLEEFSIAADHRSVIYVSTEDDLMATAHNLRKQAKNHISDGSDLKGLRFIFNDTDDYLKEIKNKLEESPADCVIIDAFTDIFSGELNASTKVRAQINEFDKLASKYKTLIIFLHHTGKRTDKYAPSKDNILGSQGFEAKMRCVLELRVDSKEADNRHLCIVKGNYISSENKSKSYVLKFNDDLNFAYTNKRVPLEAIKNLKNTSEFEEKKQKAILLAKKLKNEGLTYEIITKKLHEQGYLFSKSAINNWLTKK